LAAVGVVVRAVFLVLLGGPLCGIERVDFCSVERVALDVGHFEGEPPIPNGVAAPWAVVTAIPLAI